MEDSWSQYWLSVSRHWVPRVFERKDILVCWVYIINEFDNGIFLVSFDYQTETFRCLCLPNQCRSPYNYVSLSLVREQKRSVLRLRRRTSQIEVWVRNDETEVALWSKLLVVDSPEVQFCHLTSFFFFFLDVHPSNKFIGGKGEESPRVLWEMDGHPRRDQVQRLCIPCWGG